MIRGSLGWCCDRPDRDRPRRRRWHPHEVEDPEGAAPDRRAQHDRPRAGRRGGARAGPGGHRDRAPARAGRAARQRAAARGRAGRPGGAARHRARRTGGPGGARRRAAGGHRPRRVRRHAAPRGRHPPGLRRVAPVRRRGGEHPQRDRRRPVRVRPDRPRRRRRRPGDRGGEGRLRRAAGDHRDQLRDPRLRRRLPGRGDRPDRQRQRQGEYYLTDAVGLARSAGRVVTAHPVEDALQTEGANDRAQLADLGRELNRRIVTRWMREGVSVMDPATTWIDADVVLAPDVTLLPGTQLLGATVVAEDAVVGPDTTLEDCEIGAGARVVRTHGQLAVIGASATVGPFAYLRPGTVLGADGKIGTFVETKNARIGDGAKVPHLSYVGDAEIGEGTNIGAGTIFANYDGVAKHRTVVGRQARTGSNNTFVAPVSIGDGASTGGGTVVRRDVPAGALAVSASPSATWRAGSCRGARARRRRRPRPPLRRPTRARAFTERPVNVPGRLRGHGTPGRIDQRRPPRPLAWGAGRGRGTAVRRTGLRDDLAERHHRSGRGVPRAGELLLRQQAGAPRGRDPAPPGPDARAGRPAARRSGPGARHDDRRPPRGGGRGSRRTGAPALADDPAGGAGGLRRGGAGRRRGDAGRGGPAGRGVRAPRRRGPRARGGAAAQRRGGRHPQGRDLRPHVPAGGRTPPPARALRSPGAGDRPGRRPAYPEPWAIRMRADAGR